MAKILVPQLIDDFDGTPAGETIPFSFEGKRYAVDLSNGNAERFRSLIKPYIVAATKKRTGARKQVKHVARRADARHIRAWAKREGIEVNEKGVLPAAVREQYEAAHQRKTAKR